MKNDLTSIETALELLRRGEWPVAIKPKLKAPIGDDWGAERPTEESLRTVYAAHPAAGVGIRLGPESGVIDLEVDGPEGEASLRKLCGGDPVTLGCSSRRGPHHFFRYDPRLAKYGKSIIKVPELPGLEIRIGGDGKQLQSNCPPTIGDDGQPRRWNDCDTIAELSESVFVYLDEYLSRPPRVEPQPAAPQPRKSGFTATASNGTSPEARGRAYVFSAGFPESIAGHGGHSVLYRVACELVDGFGLSESQALPILLDWNAQKARPPESEKQVRHKLDDAIKNNPAPSRKRLDAPRPGPTVRQPVNHDPWDDRPIPIPEWPAPPEEAAYHGLAGEIVRTIEPETEADPAALLVQLLIGFGSMIGRTAFVGVGGARHHTNENALLVGQTSAGRKGTSWADVRRFFADADPEWLNGRILGGLSSGEGLIYAVRDPLEGQVPIKEKGRIVDYQTAIIDPGVTDKRLLVFESEFGGVLKALGREGNKLSAVIRQAWDGDTLASLTKGSPYRATGAHIGIVGHITADELAQLLTQCDQANGFANRMLWCCCRRSKLLPRGGRVPQHDVDRLARQLAGVVAFARSVGEIGWSQDALSLWDGEYRRLTDQRPGAYGNATSRAEAHTVRLALDYALLERSQQIEIVHLQAALALWDYCQRSARHIFGNRTGDKDADKLIDALRAAPGGLTRTEIRRGVFNGHKTGEAIASTLGKLLQQGLVRSETAATGGAPAEHWFATAPCAISARSPPAAAPSSAYGASSAGRNGGNVPPDREVFEL